MKRCTIGIAALALSFSATSAVYGTETADEGREGSYPYTSMSDSGDSSRLVDMSWRGEFRDFGGLSPTEGSPRAFYPIIAGDGGFIIPNYPRVSRSEGCWQATIGRYAFTWGFRGLICAPLVLASGSFSGVTSFACGAVGKVATKIIPFNNVCG